MKKHKSTLLTLSYISTPMLALSPSILVSCSDKNQYKYQEKNKEESKKLEVIKNEIKALNWDDFLLSKNKDNKDWNYKNFTYEEFFEFQGESNSKLHSLKTIEINPEGDKLRKSIDNDKTLENYLIKDTKKNALIKNIFSFNKNKADGDKLVVILRSIKLAPPESAILVWIWLTQKKHLKYGSDINELKFLEKKQVNLYGHWFRNEEIEQSRKTNRVWKIISYVVPAIAISGLILYIVIALLLKKKKTAFKNKKGARR